MIVWMIAISSNCLMSVLYYGSQNDFDMASRYSTTRAAYRNDGSIKHVPEFGLFPWSFYWDDSMAAISVTQG